MNSIFVELTRIPFVTQKQFSRIPEDSEWEKLFNIAEAQSLMGVCFDAISSIYDPDGLPESAEFNKAHGTENLSEDTYYRFASQALSIQERNAVVNARCVELQQMVEAAGYRCFIMKGQGNGALYGDLAMYRQPGDIDVFIEGGFGKVKGLVDKSFPTNRINRLEIQYECFSDASVEIHYKPFYMPRPKHDRILQEYLAGEMEGCYANRICLGGADGTISVPTPAFNLVHQLAHIWHHCFTEGVGLRQLMDYYFVLRTRGEDEGRDAAAVAVVERMDMSAFAEAMMWVMQEVFGLDVELMLWKPNEVGGKVLLDEVMKTGNFGKAQEDGIMSKPAGLRFFAKIGRAWRFRKFGRSAWFWIPARSVADKAWQVIHGYK